MVSAMATAGEIIDDLGGTGEVATALSLSESTVSGWRKRPGGIPAPHWAALVRLAADRGKSAITFETFAQIVAREPAEARV